MELYFAATGAIHNLDLFEKRLSTIPVLIPYEKGGKVYNDAIFAMLEPIKLYRLVFPKEYLDSFLKTLEIPVEKSKDNYHLFDKQAFVLRKALNAKPIPFPKPDAQPFFIYKDGIAIKGIGIKEDGVISYPDGDGVNKTHEAI